MLIGPWDVLPREAKESHFQSIEDMVDLYLPTNSDYWISSLRRALF